MLSHLRGHLKLRRKELRRSGVERVWGMFRNAQKAFVKRLVGKEQWRAKTLAKTWSDSLRFCWRRISNEPFIRGFLPCSTL